MNKFKFFIDVFTENRYERNTRKDIKTNYKTHLLPIKKDAEKWKWNSQTFIDTNYWTQIIEKNKKKSIKTISTSDPNLKLLLSQNKTKVLPNGYLGVYELNYVNHFEKDINTQYVFKRKLIASRENG